MLMVGRTVEGPDSGASSWLKLASEPADVRRLEAAFTNHSPSGPLSKRDSGILTARAPHNGGV